MRERHLSGGNQAKVRGRVSGLNLHDRQNERRSKALSRCGGGEMEIELAQSPIRRAIKGMAAHGIGISQSAGGFHIRPSVSTAPKGF